MNTVLTFLISFFVGAGIFAILVGIWKLGDLHGYARRQLEEEACDNQKEAR